MSVKVIQEPTISNVRLNESLTIKKLEETSMLQKPLNSNLVRSVLFSKLTFNLSKGHYLFAYELLKTNSENKQLIGVEANANELVSNQQLWLQFETNQINKKFLNGKTPLIICSYIKENDWCMTLTRLLYESGASLTLRDSTNGCYPLHYACALLKSDQIEFYLSNSDIDLSMTKDFNGNTPLIYFMISFCFYFNRNLKRSKFFSTNKYNELNCGSEQVKFNVNQQNEDFEQKLVLVLKMYLSLLKRRKRPVNTVNRLGFSLSDFYSALVYNYMDLESHEFFLLIKNAIRDDLRNTVLTISTTASTITPLENNKVTKTKIVSSMSRSSLNSDITNETYIIKHNSDSMNSKRSINELPQISKGNIEILLNKHLLIDLNEMKNSKIISHSKKLDENLLHLFMNKQIKNYNFDFIHKHEANKRVLLNAEKLDLTTMNGPIRTGATWKEQFSFIFDYWETHETKSFRKGVVSTFEKKKQSQSEKQKPSKNSTGKLPMLNSQASSRRSNSTRSNTFSLNSRK
jgi:hypothetical protein